LHKAQSNLFPSRNPAGLTAHRTGTKSTCTSSHGTR